MSKATLAGLTALAAALLMGTVDRVAVHAEPQMAAIPAPPTPPPALPGAVEAEPPLTDAEVVQSLAAARLADDLAAMKEVRPGYEFWRHIFTIPDGSIAFGSAVDGRLLAVVPTRGDWTRGAQWTEVSLASALSAQPLPKRLDDRRDLLERLLEAEAGPIVHNPTRGRFVSPNIPRYGVFLDEWASIYERFGVPAEVGLAQALVESGLSGTIRSEARAVGLCQWLGRNWKRLQRLAPNVIEGHNQTTQAPYCAAYLTILATKYGSFIPALSEHHAGGTNVGRAIINGERLGAESVRERYFRGAELARYLREASPRKYKDIYGSYGPRSFYYSEMVFGNAYNIRQIRETVRQKPIYAMRTPRALTLAAISRATGLSASEVKRFNPALVKRVPAGATIYLPSHVAALGRDVAFWHRPPTAAYTSVLREFLSIDAAPEEWDDPSFERVLREFERRFAQTKTEEGAVMATALAYTIDDLYDSRRGAILAEFRSSERIRNLFAEALLNRALATDED